jgi:apolipoprotein N-acyltransferase
VVNKKLIVKSLAASLISGLLLGISWPASGITVIIFIAWIPLLWLQDVIQSLSVRRKGSFLFIHAYLAFLSWNLFSTWWVKNASEGGAVLAFLFNSLFMALVFLMFHHTKVILGRKKGYLSLIIFWIAFEYLHLNWDLSWPWLSLGNVFAVKTQWVQWYEFTGVFGGALWIFLVNFILYEMIRKAIIIPNPFPSELFSKSLTQYGVLALFMVSVPILISKWMYHGYIEAGRPMNVVVVQPNIDPYKEKFGGMATQEQLAKLLRLAATQTDSLTDFVIGPETALAESIWEDKLEENQSVLLIQEILRASPNLTYILGLSSNIVYYTDEKPTPTARAFSQAEGYYDSFNSSMMIDLINGISIYHKSKLVPGVEKMPYPEIFGVLEDFAIDMGGTTGSLGYQEQRTVFESGSGFKVAAVICYESIYGEFMSRFVRNGAEAIFIITNDGWWGDTPGYRQHFEYARLRAIESRRSVARSANTGISCFINQKGDVTQRTGWWQEDVIKETLLANNELTFYVRFGDYIGRTFSLLSLLMLVYVPVRGIVGRK